MTPREARDCWCRPEVAQAQRERADAELALPVADVPPFRYFLDAMAKLPNIKSIVDFGCGTGAYGVVCKRNLPGVEWHGTDVSRYMIDAARQRGLSVYPMNEFPWPDAFLFSASIEYNDYPPSELFRWASGNPTRAIILHRVRWHAAHGHHVDEPSYCGLTMPMWRWNLAELETLVACAGRRREILTWQNDNQSTWVIYPEVCE